MSERSDRRLYHCRLAGDDDGEWCPMRCATAQQAAEAYAEWLSGDPSPTPGQRLVDVQMGDAVHRFAVRAYWHASEVVDDA